MRAHNLLGFLRRWHLAQPANDYFRQQSLIALIPLLAIPAWLWVGSSVQAGRLGAMSAIWLAALILGGVALAYRLQRVHYLWAVLALLAAQTLFVASALWVTRDPAFGYLFAVAIVTAMLLGPLGPLATAVAVTALQLALASLAREAAGNWALLTKQILLYLLVGGASTCNGWGLHEAVGSAELSAQQASKHAEEARRHRAELQQTLKSLDLAWAQLQRANSELFRAREAADAALRFKSEFAAQISHELRTSLNLVLGFSETMSFSQHSYGERLPAPYLRDVTEIHRNSRHLLTLIDDILDLSKLDAGRMGLRREPADLTAMLREATDIARPLIERKGLELALELPPALPAVLLDHARIRQVVLNLLSNAVRATSAGRIAIRAAHEKEQVVVQVIDTGIGIAPQRLEQVFEEFHQMEGPERPGDAVGLGLAVSRKIVQLHGGRLWAESTVGVGSTFSFALPLTSSAAYLPVTHTPMAAPPLPPPTVVMLGERETEEVRLLQRHLEGYTLLVAHTWDDAAHLASDASARAVIVNAAVNEAPDPGPLPVPLIACPLPGPKQAERAMEVACYLEKPVTLEAVQGALRRAAPNARTLLLVDDEPAAVRLIERMVQGGSRGYRVFRAYSGKEALARVRAQVPDAIMLDLSMPDGDGLWLISVLRQDPSLASIPIIVITGHAGEQAWQSGPIGIHSPVGFTPTETLRYLQALLSAVPPATGEHRTIAPPFSTERPV